MISYKMKSHSLEDIKESLEIYKELGLIEQEDDVVWRLTSMN